MRDVIVKNKCCENCVRLCWMFLKILSYSLQFIAKCKQTGVNCQPLYISSLLFYCQAINLMRTVIASTRNLTLNLFSYIWGIFEILPPTSLGTESKDQRQYSRDEIFSSCESLSSAKLQRNGKVVKDKTRLQRHTFGVKQRTLPLIPAEDPCIKRYYPLKHQFTHKTDHLDQQWDVLANVVIQRQISLMHFIHQKGGYLTT